MSVTTALQQHDHVSRCGAGFRRATTDATEPIPRVTGPKYGVG